MSGRPWIVGVLAVAVAIGAGCGSGRGTKAGGDQPRPPVVLRFASSISGGQPEILGQFAENVQRRTVGHVRIAFKANYRAGDVRQEEHTIDDVRAGRVDLAWVGARAWDAFGVHDFDALIAPLLVDSYRIEDAVFRAGIPDEMLRGVAAAGVVPLGVLPGPLRLLLAVRQPIRRPADLRGQVVGVIGQLAAQTFATLGATPRPVYAQTPLDGLDAAEMQASSVANLLYDRNARYLITNLALWPRPLVLIAAPRAVRALAPDQRQALVAAARSAARDGVATARADEANAALNLCRRHRLELVDATPEQLRAFRRAVRPVYARLAADARTRKYLARITALARGRPPPGAYRCGRSATVGFGHAPTPLDGTWEMRVSKDYLVRHHPSYLPPPPPEALLLDSGWYRYVFHRGRVSYAHKAPIIESRSTGVFRVQGNTIEIVYTAGHDAGEPPLRFRWSLYRGALSFRPIGRIPAETTLAPWHRVHD